MPIGDRLTKDDKIRSLINVFKTLSTNKDIRKKQLEVLEFFWQNYVKGCDYFPFAWEELNVYRGDKGYIYSLNWDYYNNFDKLKEAIARRSKLFLDIRKALLNEMSKVKDPSDHQRMFVNHFAKYEIDWYTNDVEYFVSIFKSPFKLCIIMDQGKDPGDNVDVFFGSYY